MFVSNSSTLILMAKITLLPKFLGAVKQVAITDDVHEEIVRKDSFENAVIRKEIQLGRIKIERIKRESYGAILSHFKMDKGEASTLALCIQKKYKGVLTDDKELIKACKIEGIQFISALASVVELWRRNVIGREEAMEKLETLQGYGRYSDEVYNYFRSMVR